MAKLKGTGAPSTRLKAAIGDIYKDTATGMNYKCIFAYQNGRTKKYESQWEEVGNTYQELFSNSEDVSNGAVLTDNETIDTGSDILDDKDKTESQSRKKYTNYSKPSKN